MADVETPQLEVVEIPDVEDAARSAEPLPDALPILPLRETVTYPDTLTPLAVGQERSINLVNDVLSGNRMLAMVASRDPENDTPGPDDLYDVGVAGSVARMMKPSESGSRATSASSLTSWRGSRRCRMCSSPPPSSRR
jgi:ATP-dependent Lon protease